MTLAVKLSLAVAFLAAALAAVWLVRLPMKEPDMRPSASSPMPIPARHFVNGNPLEPVPPGMEVAYFGMGCFWGAEKKFWQSEGVHSTAVGYQGGTAEHPGYEQVCGGGTGHAEVVRVVFDPKKTTYEKMLKVFWENHDPTQGNRQGNDVGTQYRSTIYTTTPEQRRAAEASRDAYQPMLAKAGHGKITTEIREAPPFYFAEEYHQQYLAKNPRGYCGAGGTGVACPVGVSAVER